MTMMTLWCMMRSPLMIGGELTKCDDFTLGLLTNGAALEILYASHCPHPLYTTGTKAVWIASRIDGKGCYLALFNLADEPSIIRQDIRALGLASVTSITELWAGEPVEITDALTAAFSPHDTKLYLLRSFV